MNMLLRWAVVTMAVVSVGVSVSAQSSTGSKAEVEKLNGYAEYRKGLALVVDGQRVVVNPATKIKGRTIRGFDSIPLGNEVSVKGRRLPDGALLALELEAKPNGNGMFENDIRSATDEVEAQWLQNGRVTEGEGDDEETIGRVVTRGPRVARVRRILDRVAPPYIDASTLRVHVVETNEWNAMAMGNGAIWVYTGLLDDLDDDEVAIVLGHELAHYSHEHSRRQFKRAFWAQLIAAGAVLAADALSDDDRKKAAVAVAAMALVVVKSNGYSRELEDQADRVGLRYAYEGGYDVSKGPRLWSKFRDKYGEEHGLVNFFLGDHSRASSRVKALTREIDLNYPIARTR